jgi:hypothetical protein
MRFPPRLDVASVGSRSDRNPLVLSAAKLFLVVLPLVLATPSSAYGYADPGTGAFLYQAAYAAFLGGVFYLRKMLNRFWGKRK